MAIERHLSVTAVAEVLGCSRGHVYDLIAAGKIRGAVNIGIKRSKIRIPESEVKRHLAENPCGAPGPEVAA